MFNCHVFFLLFTKFNQWFYSLTSFQFSIISTSKSLPHILFTLEIVPLISGLASYINIFDAPKALDTRATCVVTLSSLTNLWPIRRTSIFIVNFYFLFSHFVALFIYFGFIFNP